MLNKGEPRTMPKSPFYPKTRVGTDLLVSSTEPQVCLQLTQASSGPLEDVHSSWGIQQQPLQITCFSQLLPGVRLMGFWLFPAKFSLLFGETLNVKLVTYTSGAQWT